MEDVVTNPHNLQTQEVCVMHPQLPHVSHNSREMGEQLDYYSFCNGHWFIPEGDFASSTSLSSSHSLPGSSGHTERPTDWYFPALLLSHILLTFSILRKAGTISTVGIAMKSNIRRPIKDWSIFSCTYYADKDLWPLQTCCRNVRIFISSQNNSASLHQPLPHPQKDPEISG